MAYRPLSDIEMAIAGPTGSPAIWRLARSIAAGEILRVADDAPDTFCDALQTPHVSPITLNILCQRKAETLAVIDAEVEEAMPSWEPPRPRVRRRGLLARLLGRA